MRKMKLSTLTRIARSYEKGDYTYMRTKNVCKDNRRTGSAGISGIYYCKRILSGENMKGEWVCYTE